MKNLRSKHRGYRSRLEWQSIISEQRISGEDIKALCKRLGVSPQSFYRQRLLAKSKPSACAAFTELEVSIVNECEIRCRGGRSIIVRGAVCTAHLRNVLLVVEEAQR